MDGYRRETPIADAPVEDLGTPGSTWCRLGADR
jgi:hypothetical protein